MRYKLFHYCSDQSFTCTTIQLVAGQEYLWCVKWRMYVRWLCVWQQCYPSTRHIGAAARCISSTVSQCLPFRSIIEELHKTYLKNRTFNHFLYCKSVHWTYRTLSAILICIDIILLYFCVIPVLSCLSPYKSSWVVISH